jgi:hypothetical protein
MLPAMRGIIVVKISMLLWLAVCLCRCHSQLTSTTDAYGESSELMDAHDTMSLISGISSLASPESKYYKAGADEASADAYGAAPAANHTLSATCSEQYCDMLVVALSCKVFGLNLDKVRSPWR